MRTAIRLAVGVVLLTGCTPSLGGDGYYACARDRRCPAAYPVCGTDGRCHTGEIDAGPTDAPVDTGAPPFTYPSCSGDAPSTCDPNSCYFDRILDLPPDGYCTTTCTTDAECAPYQGAASGCVAGRCAHACRSQSDCPDSLACTTGRWSDTAALALCVTLDAALPGTYGACRDDTECVRPLSCVAGVCLRTCATTSDCVIDLEQCVSSTTGARGCLEVCANAGECSGIGDLCTGGTCRPSAGW